MPIGVRGFARTLIQGMTGKGFSNRAIIRAVRNKGWGYRTGLMNDDINLFAGRSKYQTFITKLNVNDVVPFSLMNETELRMPRKYQVFGTTQNYDPFTDTYVFETRSMYTDDLTQTGNWEDEYLQRYGDICPSRPYELMGFEVTGVDHNKGWSY